MEQTAQTSNNDGFSNEYISNIEKLAHIFDSGTNVTDSPACQWFTTLKEAVKQHKRLCADVAPKLKATLLVSQLTRILHDQMLTQRWPKALTIMNQVCRVPVGSSAIIWKAGMELLLTEPNANSDFIRQLYNQMKQLPDLMTKDIMMEYATFLLSHRETEAAFTVLQENMMRGMGKIERTAHGDYAYVSFRAYMGLVWYMEWLECQRKMDEINSQPDTSMFDVSVSQSLSQAMSAARNLEMQATNLAKKAILGFEAIVGVPGVWDVFLTKHVELLEHGDMLDEALVLLQKYRDQNEDNFNAHVYLYEFYTRHQPGSDNVTQTLKTIANKVPSHPLVLELCRILGKEESSAAIPYLFTLLDYSCWQTDVAPWTMLAQCLQDITSGSSKADDSAVSLCWSGRRSWFPAFHFSRYQAVRDTGTSGLIFPKAEVAAILCGKDNEYTTTAVGQLTTAELAHLESISPSRDSGVT